MPAKTSAYIQKFLNKYPVINNTLRTTLINNVGKLNPALYEYPKEENVSKINLLIDTLVSFEKNALAANVNAVRTNRLLNRIVQILGELELNAIRPLESGVDDDWIMFAPKVIDDNTPVKIAAVLVYRFGFVRDLPTDSDPNFTVGNLGLVSEHSLADGTESLTADMFLKGKAKFILANFFRPHIVKNPDFDPTRANSIRYFTDPAHSNTTIFLPMLTSLLQYKFPKIPILIMHGMSDSLGKDFQVLMGNCFGNFRNDGWRSFANMLAISFGVEDYFTTEANRDANLPSPVVAVQSRIPNYVLKGNQIVPMSSISGTTNGALRYPQGFISSNVTGHIRYFAQKPLNERILNGYQCSDNSIHMETSGYIRSNKDATNPNRDKFVNVVLRAMKWYMRYDAAIHDPHRLKERFIERSQNMKLYDELFSAEVIDRYKKRNLLKYLADTASYERAFAAKKQLPPELDIALMLSASSATASNVEEDMPHNDLADADYETDNEVEGDSTTANLATPRQLRFLKSTSSGARADRDFEEDAATNEQVNKKQKNSMYNLLL